MKTHQTAKAVTGGTILFREGVLLPPEIDLQTAKHSAEWQSVPGVSGYAFDRKLRVLGWSCMFLPTELKTRSFGSSQAAMLKSALKKLLAEVRGLDCNCAEIATITRSRFLGIPYLTVRAHARHIQQSYELDGRAQRKKQQQAIDWARE